MRATKVIETGVVICDGCKAETIKDSENYHKFWISVHFKGYIEIYDQEIRDDCRAQTGWTYGPGDEGMDFCSYRCACKHFFNPVKHCR